MRTIEVIDDLMDCFESEEPMTGLAWLQFSSESIDVFSRAVAGLEALAGTAEISSEDRDGIEESIRDFRLRLSMLSGHCFDSKHYRREHRHLQHLTRGIALDLVECSALFKETQEQKTTDDPDQLGWC